MTDLSPTARSVILELTPIEHGRGGTAVLSGTHIAGCATPDFEVSARPTAAIVPMDDPYCSCELTLPY